MPWFIDSTPMTTSVPTWPSTLCLCFRVSLPTFCSKGASQTGLRGPLHGSVTSSLLIISILFLFNYHLRLWEGHEFLCAVIEMLHSFEPLTPCPNMMILDSGAVGADCVLAGTSESSSSLLPPEGISSTWPLLDIISHNTVIIDFRASNSTR